MILLQLIANLFALLSVSYSRLIIPIAINSAIITIRLISDNEISRLTTIRRDSGLLDQKDARLAVRKLDGVLKELKELQILMDFQKQDERGKRNCILDVKYTLTSDIEFINTFALLTVTPSLSVFYGYKNLITRHAFTEHREGRDGSRLKQPLLN